MIDWELGATLNEKSAAATLRAASAVRVSEPLVPLTVIPAVPAGVLPVVLTVSTELPGTAGFGEKLHATPVGSAAPVGRPLQDSRTASVNPP